MLSFLKNKLFFEKHLQGESQREDVEIFWDSSMVLPNTYFSNEFLSTQNMKDSIFS